MKFLFIAAALVIAAVSFAGWLPMTGRSEASASGPSPSFTGAPLESNCTACHSTFKVNSGTGGVVISGLPQNYLPGQQIPITVTVNDASGVLYGFQLTAVDQSGAKVGEFVIPEPSPSPGVATMQVVTGFVNGQERKYIEHTIQGVTPSTFGTRSWQFNWTAPERRVGKLGFYAAGNAANSDSSSDGDQIYTTAKHVLSGTAIASFDGDQRSDISVYRPSTGVWYSINSDQTGVKERSWGMAGDVAAPGDYDGDGIADRAVFRPSNGTWWIQFSSSGAHAVVSWGIAEDTPVPADYDGDGKTDVAVFRPSESKWWIIYSSGGYTALKWGVSSDIPVQGDYDGDGKADYAVYRPFEGVWYVLRSSDGVLVWNFGLSTDVPVPGDYDGDGKYDIAIYRPSDGSWWLQRSSAGLGVVNFGLAEDVPAPADYDGDGKFDAAVFRPSNGAWYIKRSGDSGVTSANWGILGDVPVAAAY